MVQKKVLPEQFSDLHLNIGDLFNMESLSSNKRYPVKLVGFVEGRSLIVTAPRVNGKEFILPEQQLFRVRLIAGKYACGFQTRVLANRQSPYLYSHLSYPTKFEAVAIRQASRVQLSVKAVITEAQAGTVHGSWPREELLVDVSSGGAKIYCTEPLAATGSKLKVAFWTEVDGVRKQMQIAALVRNISEVRDGFQYGVQFTEVTDEERVYISGFVYEQMLGKPDRTGG